MWRREANSVANKSEYIREECREGYELRKSLKYKKQQKETECFAKFIKRIRRGLKNIQLQFTVCVSYESDLQLK